MNNLQLASSIIIANQLLEIERLRNLLIEALPWIGDIPADPDSMKCVNELIIEIQNEIDKVE